MICRSRLLQARLLLALACALPFGQSSFAYDEQQYQALMHSAREHTKMMELEKAIKDLTAAIKLNPTNPRTFQVRSENYRDLNLLPESLRDMTRAIELAPSQAGLWRDRGYLYFKNSQYKEAVADYTKALEIEPNDAGAYRSRGRSYSC